MFDLSVTTIVEAILELTIIVMVGLYFIFSNTIMAVLAEHPNGAQVMVAINKQILNPWFMMCFIVSGVAGLYFFFFHMGPKAWAGIIFFIGTTAVTAVFNVPLNDKLRDAHDNALAAVWRIYLKRWVVWNHLRTGSALLAGVLFAMA